MATEREINELIDKVKNLYTRYQLDSQDSTLQFNIFQILKMERLEVRTHSAMLAALFEPNKYKSLHGRQFFKIFLNKQIEYFKNQYPKFVERLENFGSENNYTVTVEYYAGQINETTAEGGRVDLILRNSNNKTLIIENKIDAADQDKQLIRYNAVDKNAPIFYLTLFGTAPSPNSIGELVEGDNYVCISYQKHIYEWLIEIEQFQNIDPDTQFVLRQYKNLIEILTFNTKTDMMEKYLIDLMSNKENIKIASLINKNWIAIKRKIIENAFAKISIAKKHSNETELSFDLEKHENYCIKSFWGDNHFKDLQFRIEKKSSYSNGYDEESIRECLMGKFPNASKIFLPETEAEMNSYVWAIVFDDWYNTSWENIEDKLPESIEKLISDINAAMSPS